MERKSMICHVSWFIVCFFCISCLSHLDEQFFVYIMLFTTLVGLVEYFGNILHLVFSVSNLEWLLAKAKLWQSLSVSSVYCDINLLHNLFMHKDVQSYT